MMDIGVFAQCKSEFPMNFTFPPDPKKIGEMTANGMKLPDTSVSN
jgi:hypothetical protein